MTVTKRVRKRTLANGKVRTRTTWRCRVADPDKPGAMIETTHATKSDAEAAETLTLAKIAGIGGTKHIAKGKGATLVRDVAQSWKATWSIKPLSPLTQRDYQNILTKHIEPRWGDVKVADIDVPGVQAWVGELSKTLKVESVMHIYGVLRSVLKVAEQHGLISTSPASKVSITLPDRKVEKATAPDQLYLTAPELRTLAEAMPTERDRIMVEVAGLLGLRSSEQLALRRRDIDLKTNRVSVRFALKDVSGVLQAGPTKSAERRSLSIPERLRKPLADLAKDKGVRVRPVVRVTGAKDARELQDRAGGYPIITDAGVLAWTEDPTDDRILIFRTPGGSPIRQGNHYSKVYRPVVNALWPEPDPRSRLRWHDLRHTNASLMLGTNGGDLAKLQKRLGHTSIKTTFDRYSHLIPGDDEDISDALNAMYEARPGTWDDDIELGEGS